MLFKSGQIWKNDDFHFMLIESKSTVAEYGEQVWEIMKIHNGAITRYWIKPLHDKFVQ